MTKSKTKLRPSAEFYGALQTAFDHFNKELFGSALPSVVLTLTTKSKVAGYFAPECWSKGVLKAHEISINPNQMIEGDLLEMCQTLVHEMVHLQQELDGTTAKTPSYHNSDFADKMEAVGLIASTTGAPGGKRTGYGMSDYPIPCGVFMTSFEKLMDRKGFGLNWYPRQSIQSDAPKPKSKNSKTKYECRTCEAKAWGSSTLHLLCGDCSVPMSATA